MIITSNETKCTEMESSVTVVFRLPVTYGNVVLKEDGLKETKYE